MSRTDRSARRHQRRRLHSFAVEIPLVIGLMLIWAVLWGELSAKNLLVGAVLAVLVTRLLALPPVHLSTRFSPLDVVLLAVSFLWQITRSTAEVTWVVLRRGPRTRSSIVGIPMRTHSDLILTAVGSTTGLIPGSVLLEVDRSTSTLYYHVLDASTPEAQEAFRQSVLNTEAAWLRVMGTPREHALLRQEDREEGRRTPRAILHSAAHYTGDSGRRRGVRRPLRRVGGVEVPVAERPGQRKEEAL